MLRYPKGIFEKYIFGNILALKRIDTSHSVTDKRFAYIIDTDLEEHIVIKISNNAFTVPERTVAWKSLIQIYNKNGIYCPQIITDKAGNLHNEYWEGSQKYIAYAEEKKKYKTTEEFGIPRSDNSFYFEDMVRAAAKIAKCSQELPPWKSAWCIYDKFCEDDETDETYYWQEEFHKLVLNEMPSFSAQAERIWKRFITMYESFESQYRALPQAFFQEDEGGLNVMLDDQKRFVGLIDFNLAGTETILNYFFRNFCRVHITKGEVSQLGDTEYLCNQDNAFRRKIEIVKKYYKFSESEKQAFPTYYKMVYPLECDLCQLFQSVILSKDREKTALILNWIEYQQTRNDVTL